METISAAPTPGDRLLEATGQNELARSIRREVTEFAVHGIAPQALYVDVDDNGDALFLDLGNGPCAVPLESGKYSCFGGRSACRRQPGTPGPCMIFDALSEELAVDMIVMHHSISYLPHRVAVCLLKRLQRMSRPGGKLFISALGLFSDLGDRYPDADRDLAKRFAAIETPDDAHPMATTALCLYTERDLILTLLSGGWSVLRSSSTSEGNVLATAVSDASRRN